MQGCEINRQEEKTLLQLWRGPSHCLSTEGPKECTLTLPNYDLERQKRNLKNDYSGAQTSSSILPVNWIIWRCFCLCALPDADTWSRISCRFAHFLCSSSCLASPDCFWAITLSWTVLSFSFDFWGLCYLWTFFKHRKAVKRHLQMRFAISLQDSVKSIFNCFWTLHPYSCLQPLCCGLCLGFDKP